MGEAARRARAGRLVADLQYLNKEAAGVWSLDIIFPDNLPAMVQDIVTAELLGVTAKADVQLKLLENALLTLQPDTLCLLCERTVGGQRIAAFVLAGAQQAAPTGAIVNFVCPHCAEQGETLAERVGQYYKDHLFGEDARIVMGPLPAPGTA